MSLIDRSATALLTDLESRKLSSVELTRAYLDQIQKHDGKVKAFLLVDVDAALARAKEIECRSIQENGVPQRSRLDQGVGE